MELPVNKILVCCFLIYFLKSTSASTGFREKKCTYAFKTFLDLNGDGKLNVADFDKLAGYFINLKHLDINGKEHTKLKEYVHTIMDGILEQAGARDVGYIKLDQWIRMWDKYTDIPDTVPAWQHKYIDLVFKWMDNNDDGSISRNDFVSFLVGHGKDGIESGASFDKFSEGKGLVDRNRFLELWKQYFTSDDFSAPGNFLAGKPDIDIN